MKKVLNYFLITTLSVCLFYYITITTYNFSTCEKLYKQRNLLDFFPCVFTLNEVELKLIKR